ncbi:MAG: DUF4097 domain-containing protein [Prevotellaceae bacterium]|jgi:hypothetical protein|nr:DUF4097 domain-containing protein [Prevotellaceae bacterium]
MKKKYFALLLFDVFVSASLFAQEKKHYEFMQSYDFPVASIQKVNARLSWGNIIMQGNSADETKVELFLCQIDDGEAQWPKEKMQEEFNKHCSLDVKVENGILNVYLKQKKQWSWKKFYTFRISRPELFIIVKVNTNRKADIQLNTDGGEIKIEKTTGNLAALTEYGNIKASDCSGEISLTAEHGSIILDKIDGNLKAYTDHGYIKGSDCKGTLLFDTDHGNIKLINIVGSMEAKAQNGNISADIAAATDQVKLSSYDGDVSLTLPKEKGYKVKIKAERIDLKKEGVLFNGFATTKSVEGVINEGGAPVIVHADRIVKLMFK